jgi:hypothetical protein
MSAKRQEKLKMKDIDVADVFPGSVAFWIDPKPLTQST